jgi:hypothetical protein
MTKPTNETEPPHGVLMTKPTNETEPPHGVLMTKPTKPDPAPSITPGASMLDNDDTLPGFPPDQFARVQLAGIASTMGHDELRVLTRIAERLQGGQLTYGPLNLSSDPRSFRSQEAREEIEDALVYLACAWLKSEEVAA